MNTMTDTTPPKESKANEMKTAYVAGVKKAAYAAVGAPVIAAKHVGRMSGTWRKSAKREFEKWVSEGERMTAEIRDGKVVGEIKEKVDFDHLQGRVEKLRDLAERTNVSNPYLSQIERGLRKPSAEVLQQIAKAMRISAESLYVRAGIIHPADGVGGSVELAILGDTGLTERQKQSLLDVYSSFLAMNDAHPNHPTEGDGHG